MSETLDTFSQTALFLVGRVAEDVSSPAVLSVLAISLLGVSSGLLAFRRNDVAAATVPKVAGTARTLLYWLSLLPSALWYVFPFLPQARFPSLYEGLSQGRTMALIVGLAGGLVFVWYGLRALRIFRENQDATGAAMVDFLRPSRLLVDGGYARVRHPMFLYDFLAHSGLAVAAGALTTLALLPLYFLFSAAFNVVEERWVLAPRFGDAFDRYRARVPGYMTREGGVILSLLALGAVYLAQWAG